MPPLLVVGVVRRTASAPTFRAREATPSRELEVDVQPPSLRIELRSLHPPRLFQAQRPLKQIHVTHRSTPSLSQINEPPPRPVRFSAEDVGNLCECRGRTPAAGRHPVDHLETRAPYEGVWNVRLDHFTNRGQVGAPPSGLEETGKVSEFGPERDHKPVSLCRGHQIGRDLVDEAYHNPASPHELLKIGEDGSIPPRVSAREHHPSARVRWISRVSRGRDHLKSHSGPTCDPEQAPQPDVIARVQTPRHQPKHIHHVPLPTDGGHASAR